MSSKSILVLDSDVQRLTQIRYTLSLHGYKVLEATNAREAETICFAGEIPIDLVILNTAAELDFKWPQRRPCTPVLLLRMPSEHQFQTPHDDFWQLPFDPEQLLSDVGSALAETGAAKRAATADEDIGRIESTGTPT